jgi:hypothetical protein
VTDRNFSTENQENVVDLDARRAVPASDGKLTPEVFENPGAVVDETVAPVTATTSFGQNVRTKAFFESAIDASWQKSTQGIFDTGRWLQRAREELSRNDYDALRLPFCVRTRQRLIAIAAHPILATHVSQLPPSWGTLYALAEINNYNLLRAPLADGRIHPGLQRKDVRSALGLPPKPPRGRRKGNGQTEAPLDPVAVWKSFSEADKKAILNSEGRSGLAKLLSRELMVDLVDHLIRQEMVGASTKLKPAVTFTTILRTALDSTTNDSGAVIERFKAKLKSLNLDLHSVSVALKGRGRGKR